MVGLLCVGIMVAVLLPAFSGRVEFDPVLDLGVFTIRWYGLILSASVLVGYFLARSQAWRFGLSHHELDNFVFWLVIVGLIGARVYFVLFEFSWFASHPIEIFKVWNGGISIFGALISGLLFTFIYSKNKIFPAWQLLDLVGLVLPVAQALGRFGNFVNYEAFGLPTALPWKMFVPVVYRPEKYLIYDFFHPAFLYESLANLVLFFILWQLRGKFKVGSIALSYLAGYALIRVLIELVRIDSVIIGGVKADLVVGILVFIFALGLLIKRNKIKQV